MNTITRNELTKFSASESVTASTRFVALGDDNCVWGVGETETQASSDALSELREVREDQKLRAMTDDEIMEGVTVYAVAPAWMVEIAPFTEWAGMTSDRWHPAITGTLNQTNDSDEVASQAATTAEADDLIEMCVANGAHREDLRVREL
jgi:hypothetical protein